MTDQLEDLYDKTDVALLAAGGKDALVCFIRLSRRVLDGAGKRGLRVFAMEVMPLLPPAEQAELVVLLFTTLVDDWQTRNNAMPATSCSLH